MTSKVDFQYGGRLFFRKGSSYILAVNGDISTKFGLVIDFDLLKAEISTNAKPVIVFSVRGRHLEKNGMTSYFCSVCCDLDEIR